MRIRLGLAQINPVAGDLEGNAEFIREIADKASGHGCDLIVFPQLALSGFPLGRLLEREDFLRGAARKLKDLARALPDCAALVGYPEISRGKVYNSCALLHDGRTAKKFRMTRGEIPSIAVPSEAARFSHGRGTNAFAAGGARIDVLFDTGRSRAGGGLTIYLSAAPFARDLSRPRPSCDGPSCVSNLVGGQDGVVFYGAGAIRAAGGDVVAGCRAFDTGYCTADIDLERGDTENLYEISPSGNDSPLPEAEALEVMSESEEIYKSLLVGLRDFVRKNGFQRVLVGASGGVDSSLVLAVACDALGKNNVTAVSMPSAITSEETRRDAASLAQNLGCRFLEIPIEESVAILADAVPGAAEHRLAKENLQARIRGTILMTLANVEASIVLATGNRSEVQTGYCTLYGDTVGGYAPIGDISKATVYELVELVNRKGEIIPRSVVERAPSAELSPGQTDQEKLPPYPELDAMLEALLDRGSTPDALVKTGFDGETVRKVAEMIRASEHKRNQLPPATLVHRASIARHVAVPLTNGFRF
jgi:NAD+ synthase (glutamine-hydrolysing)